MAALVLVVGLRARAGRAGREGGRMMAVAVAPGGTLAVARFAQDRWGPDTPIGEDFVSPLAGHVGPARIAIPDGGTDFALVFPEERPSRRWAPIPRTWAVELKPRAKDEAQQRTLAGVLGTLKISGLMAPIWSVRLYHRVGAAPLAVPDAPYLRDASDDAVKMAAGFAEFCACRAQTRVGRITLDDGVLFSVSTAAWWTLMPRSRAALALRELRDLGVLQQVGEVKTNEVFAHPAKVYRSWVDSSSLLLSDDAPLVRRSDQERPAPFVRDASCPEDAPLVLVERRTGWIGCRYPEHSSTGWIRAGGGPVVCGVCHPAPPGLAIEPAGLEAES